MNNLLQIISRTCFNFNSLFSCLRRRSNFGTVAGEGVGRAGLAGRRPNPNCPTSRPSITSICCGFRPITSPIDSHARCFLLFQHLSRTSKQRKGLSSTCVDANANTKCYLNFKIIIWDEEIIAK